MNQFKRWCLPSLLALLMVGCSHLDESLLVDNGGDRGGNVATLMESRQNISDAPKLKNAASIRIGRYIDARMMANPRKMGTGKVNGFGMSGKDIILDEDAADMVVNALKKRLNETGFRVAEEHDANVLFELSGKVKELLFSVKARDEVSIVVESTLRNVVTGKTLWSGIVVQENHNFEGVPRIHKEDISSFLKLELDIVSAKTIESIINSLLISNPELFNPVSGLKPIPGVTVLVAPVAPTPAPEPVDDEASSVATTPPVYNPSVKATSGMLAIKTKPARAKVYIDGVYHGLTPFYLEMEGGLYTVSIKVEGYRMMTEKVSVRKKNITEMDLTLER